MDEAIPISETPLVSIDQFATIKLKTAEVVSAVNHPKADRLMILQLKVGDKTKQIVAGIRPHYSAEAPRTNLDLLIASQPDAAPCIVGKTIIIVDNLQPVKLRGEDSNGMLLAVRTPEGGLRLLTVDGSVPSGLPVG